MPSAKIDYEWHCRWATGEIDESGYTDDDSSPVQILSFLQALVFLKRIDRYVRLLEVLEIREALPHPRFLNMPSTERRQNVRQQKVPYPKHPDDQNRTGTRMHA